MANPFTYLELHTTDASRAKTFYAELFDWKTKDTPVPAIGAYTEIDTQEGPEAGLMTQQEPGGRSALLAYIKVPKLDETVSRGAEARRDRDRAQDRGQGRRLVRGPAGSRRGPDRRVRGGWMTHSSGRDCASKAPGPSGTGAGAANQL